jgi:ABC-type multidrug transport system ATPase subunit
VIPALAMRGVTKTLGAGSDRCVATARVLSRIDLDVWPAEVVGVAGADLCARTTLLLCAAGLMTPDEGEIRWFGDPVRTAPVRGVRFVSEHETSYPFVSVREALQQAASAERGDVGLRRIEHAMALLGLDDQEDRPISHLAPEARRCLVVARALLTRPRLLVIDGWRCGARPPTRRCACDGLRYLADDGCAVLLSTDAVDGLHVGAYRATVLRAGRVEHETRRDLHLDAGQPAASARASGGDERERAASLVAEPRHGSVDPMFRRP